MSVLKGKLIDLRLDVDPGDAGRSLEQLSLDLIVKMSDIADNGVMLHLAHMVKSDDPLVSGGGYVDIDDIQHVLCPHNLEPLHAGLKCADWVHFGYVDAGPAAPERLRAAFANVAETADQGLFAGDHDVGCAVDAVDDGMLAAVDIVEL